MTKNPDASGPESSATENRQGGLPDELGNEMSERSGYYDESESGMSNTPVGQQRQSPDAVPDPSVFDRGVDHAVRAFQQHKGLIVDGVVGPETEAALNDAQYTLGDRPLSFDESQPMHGDDVDELQNNLSLLGFYYGHLDGTFNRQTEFAVRELQSSLGVRVDGEVALETLAGLARVSKKITSSKAFSLRDHRRLGMLHEALRGRAVILIPSEAIAQETPQGAPDDFAGEPEVAVLPAAAPVVAAVPVAATGAPPVVSVARA